MILGVDVIIMTIACLVATVTAWFIVSKVMDYEYEAATKMTTAAFCASAFMVAAYLIMSIILDAMLGLYW